MNDTESNIKSVSDHNIHKWSNSHVADFDSILNLDSNSAVKYSFKQMLRDSLGIIRICKQAKSSYIWLIGLISLILFRIFLTSVYGYINKINGAIYDSLQSMNLEMFKGALLSLSVVFLILILSIWIYNFISLKLKLVVSRWLTEHITNQWLKVAYPFQIFSRATDNPDERITNDIYGSIGSAISILTELVESISSIIIFGYIIYGLGSGSFLDIMGTKIAINHFIFCIAVCYAIFVSICVLRIMRVASINLFYQERFLANFRFGLMRIREYADVIASYCAEKFESLCAKRRLDEYIEVLRRGNMYNLRYIGFTSLCSNGISLAMFVILGPMVFVGKISLGILSQALGAFEAFTGGLLFISTAYRSIMQYKVAIMRINMFYDKVISLQDQSMQYDNDLEEGATADKCTEILTNHDKSIIGDHKNIDILEIKNLRIIIPSFQCDAPKIIESKGEISFSANYYIVGGPSGAGKSMLLRAISGAWKIYEGEVIHGDGKIMLITQRGYTPSATLRDVMIYPNFEMNISDAELLDLMKRMNLSHLGKYLSNELPWDSILSGGERQRIALIQAILKKPRYLLLDETFSGLDDESHKIAAEVIDEHLRSTTIIEVTHNSYRLLRQDPVFIEVQLETETHSQIKVV